MLKDLILAGYGTIQGDYDRSYNCAERILNGANQEYNLGMDFDTLHMASGFGGGMFSGSTCGAICAAVMIIGRLETGFNQHQTPSLKIKLAKLLSDYEADVGSLLCRDLRPTYGPQNNCQPLMLKTAEMLDQYYLNLLTERKRTVSTSDQITETL